MLFLPFTLSWLALLYFNAADAYAVYTPVHGKNRTIDGREVYNPPIMRPDASTTWTAGYTAEVTWDTTNMLSESASSTGTIFLGHLNDGSDNEHLDLDNPLADGFKMTMGQIEIEVPRVSPGNNYIVVLMGDSGNRSPTFTIQ